MKRNNVFWLIVGITALLPLASYGEANADLRLSATIERLKKSKPGNIELNQIVTENGFIRLEGSASESALVLNYFDAIEERKIGQIQDNGITSAERDGHPISNFFVYVEPVSAEDLHPFISMADTRQSDWWLGAEFHPFGQVVRGKPIKSINATWCSANEFERELFPKNMLRSDHRGYYDQLGAILKDGRSFSVTGKFDGVRQLTALVGVYESCDKKTGTFLLLLDMGKRNTPVVFLKEYDEQFFAYLQPNKKNELILWDCYECDGATLYQWDKATNRLVGKSLGD